MPSLLEKEQALPLEAIAALHEFIGIRHDFLSPLDDAVRYPAKR
jgi:hypothetical protein